MPLIQFKCECGHSESTLVSNKDLKTLQNKKTCPVCQKTESLKRQLGSGTFNSKIVIDDGTMAKSIEVLRNVQEIKEDIQNKDKKIPKGQE